MDGEVDIGTAPAEGAIVGAAGADAAVYSAAERDLERRLTAAAAVGKAVAAAQALQLLVVFDTIMTARVSPEVYVLPNDRLRHEKRIELAERSAVLDLAMRLTVPESTIWGWYHDAGTLISRLPAVWERFRVGEIPLASARIAADTARSLETTLADDDDDNGGDLAAAVEDALGRLDRILADRAARLTTTKFKAAAKAARERLHPVDAVARHRHAFEGRFVQFDPGDDGMGWLTGYLDAPTLVAVRERVEAAATARRDAGDERTLTQLRADALADILTGRGSPGAARIRAVVTVPVTALLNHPELLTRAADDPAVLDGYGPIDPETAGRLVADAPSFRRVFTDPITGVELNLDRKKYRPTTAQRDWLRRRYGSCVIPTCARPVNHSDTDHTLAWCDGGTTDTANLAPLSRGHHTLKHATKVTVEQRPDGSYLWHTPTGYDCDSDPPPF